MPALRAIHPAAENVLRTVALLRDEAELLDGLVEREIAAAPIAIARLGELPAALARLVVIASPSTPAAASCRRPAERLEEILELGARGGSGRAARRRRRRAH